MLTVKEKWKMELSSKWLSSYMEIAYIISKHSYAKKKQVGAIIVKDLRIISTGYNGTPSGFPNACEDEQGITYPEVLHAESNAISKCAKSTESSEDSILFVTLSPCLECAKLIIQCGIKEVYYSQQYRDTRGIDLLNKAKIKTFGI